MKQQALHILLKATWNRTLGKRLKYRLQKMNYTYKKVGWSIKVFFSEEDFHKKETWQLRDSATWFSLKDQSISTLKGLADPFLIVKDEKVHLFFEAIVDKKGEIWSAEFFKNRIVNPKPVLVEDFHLSFPNVFKYDDSFYMLPESNEDSSVRLYKAAQFPNSWELVKTLHAGNRFVDTIFLQQNDIFYWFTYDIDMEKSRLFYSDSLTSEWNEHPVSPFNSNRNGGSFIFFDDKIVRPVQISEEGYGEGLRLSKIENINLQVLEESDFINPFLTKSLPFDLDGTHHISIVDYLGDKLIATDGKNNNFYSILKN